MTYFTDAEMQCKCERAECDASKRISEDLRARLDLIRERVGRPMIVTSGLRCPWWNQKQGGVPTSEHLTGCGADIACRSGAERMELLAANFATQPPVFTRLGIGRDFVHFGVSKVLPAHVVWTYYPSKG